MLTPIETLKELGPCLPGSRVGVLLIHGMTGTPAEMLTVAKGLHQYGFTVLCPQLAGHCTTEEDLLKTNWRDWVKSVETAHDRMLEQMDVIFVGGISAGATLALHLAATRPDLVRGLALYSTTIRWNGWAIPKLSFLLPLVLRIPYIGKRYRFAEAYPYGVKDERLRRRLMAKMQSGDVEAVGLSGFPGMVVREMWRMLAHVKRELVKVVCPTLLIHAREDEVATLWNAEYVRKRVTGPTELLVLEDSYHMITVDKERHLVSRASAEFFMHQLNDEEQVELSSKARRAWAVPDGEAHSPARQGALSRDEENHD